MHQTGYLDGLYVGYILAMMSLVDNEAPKDLILSVRDDIRPNLSVIIIMIEKNLLNIIKMKNMHGLILQITRMSKNKF